MSLRPRKEDFSLSRIRKSFPIFLLLWGGSSVLALFYLLSLRSHHHTIELSETNNLLSVFIASQRSIDSQDRRHRPVGRMELHGLAFVRIVQDDDQFVLADNMPGIQHVESFVELDVDKSGVWQSITVGNQSHLYTVVSKRFNNKTIVQVGKASHKSYELYMGMVRFTIVAIVGSILLLYPLALYFIKLSLLPLIATREEVIDLCSKHKTSLLPENGNGPEIDSLYQQINQLIKQNRILVAEMQQSLDNVAHDLRTPMTRLRSVAEYGLQAREDNSRLREALSDCLEESERVLGMLKIMMSVAEAESGTMQLNIEKCDINKTLEQIVILYEYVAEEKNVTIESLFSGPLYTLADETRISQVWANLLDNAIKYGKDGGFVRLESKVQDDVIVIQFSDNGMGISKTEQEKVWERLYRGDRSRSQKGLGLGLNYVRAVVEAHGGQVELESTLQAGSCFSVYLPFRNELEHV